MGRDCHAAGDGQPIAVTLRALDVSNQPATRFNGPVVFSGTGQGGSDALRLDFESGLQGCVTNNSYGNGQGLWHLSTGRGANAGHSPVTSLYYGHNEGPAGGGNYNTGGGERRRGGVATDAVACGGRADHAVVPLPDERGGGQWL